MLDNSSDKILALLQQPHLSDEDIEWLLNHAGELREGVQMRFITRLQEEYTGHSARAAEKLKELHEKLEMPDLSVAPVHRVHFLKTAWFRYAAAIIIVFGIGAYLWNTQKEKPSVATTNNPVPLQNDVAPGGDKAVLTLADGTTIVLDSAGNGLLAKEGETNITKKDGSIIYDTKNYPPSEGVAGSAGGGPVSYNTMTTPRGGQYQLTLPDGTQVWLNAESSITYPTAFSGKERKVSIRGEAYFEVKKDKSRKFIVSVLYPPLAGVSRQGRDGGGLEIEVLGTKFNVSAYSDEPNTSTTLLEGSVKLSLSIVDSRLSDETALILRPGQQGQLKPGQQFSLVAHPDLEQVLAWKNGAFSFEKIELAKALREIARWYDVEIIYTNGIPEVTVGGGMGRDLNLSEVVKVLQGLGVNVRLEQKKLYISQ